MAETLRSDAEVAHTTMSPASALGSALHQTFWFALGIIATVGEQATWIAGALVEKGRNAEPTVLRPMRRAASEVTDAAGGATSRLKLAAGRVDLPGVLHRVAVPTKDEFDKLADEVRELRARLAEKAASATGEATDKG